MYPNTYLFKIPKVMLASTADMLTLLTTYPVLLLVTFLLFLLLGATILSERRRSRDAQRVNDKLDSLQSSIDRQEQNPKNSFELEATVAGIQHGQHFIDDKLNRVSSDVAKVLKRMKSSARPVKSKVPRVVFVHQRKKARQSDDAVVLKLASAVEVLSRLIAPPAPKWPAFSPIFASDTEPVPRATQNLSDGSKLQVQSMPTTTTVTQRVVQGILDALSTIPVVPSIPELPLNLMVDQSTQTIKPSAPELSIAKIAMQSTTPVNPPSQKLEPSSIVQAAQPKEASLPQLLPSPIMAIHEVKPTEGTDAQLVQSLGDSLKQATEQMTQKEGQLFNLIDSITGIKVEVAGKTPHGAPMMLLRVDTKKLAKDGARGIEIMQRTVSDAFITYTNDHEASLAKLTDAERREQEAEKAMAALQHTLKLAEAARDDFEAKATTSKAELEARRMEELDRMMKQTKITSTSGGSFQPKISITPDSDKVAVAEAPPSSSSGEEATLPQEDRTQTPQPALSPPRTPVIEQKAAILPVDTTAVALAKKEPVLGDAPTELISGVKDWYCRLCKGWFPVDWEIDTWGKEILSTQLHDRDHHATCERCNREVGGSTWCTDSERNDKYDFSAHNLVCRPKKGTKIQVASSTPSSAGRMGASQHAMPSTTPQRHTPPVAPRIMSSPRSTVVAPRAVPVNTVATTPTPTGFGAGTQYQARPAATTSAKKGKTGGGLMGKCPYPL